MARHPLYRTAMCMYGSECPRKKKCNFAHAESQLRCPRNGQGEVCTGKICLRTRVHNASLNPNAPATTASVQAPAQRASAAPKYIGSSVSAKAKKEASRPVPVPRGQYKGPRKTVFASAGIAPDSSAYVAYVRDYCAEARHKEPPSYLVPVVESAETADGRWLNVPQDVRDRITAAREAGQHGRASADLVWIEALQSEKDLLSYAIDAKTPEESRDVLRPPSEMMVASNPGLYRECICVYAKGLAEKRPSVLRGDDIHICDVERDTWHKGAVHHANEDHLVVHMDRAFRARFKFGSPVSVRFAMNFVPTQRCVNAVLDPHGLPRLPSAWLSVTRGGSPPASLQGLQRLNEQQREFAVDVLESRARLSVLHGPPGTGKTFTIVGLIAALIEHSQAVVDGRPRGSVKVLVTTPSNESADLVAERLLESFGAVLRTCPGPKPVLRFLAASRNVKQIPEAVRPYATHSLRESDVSAATVVVTTMCSAHAVVGVIDEHSSVCFSHFIADEAGQCTEPELAIPLRLVEESTRKRRAAPCVILAGDHKQLGPVIRNGTAVQCGLATSPLERVALEASLAGLGGVFMLLRTHRCGPSLVEVFNPTYGNKLIPAREDTRGLAHPLLFVHVDGAEKRGEDSPSWQNTEECHAVIDAIGDLLLHHGATVKVQGTNILSGRVALDLDHDIIVITPYNSQVHAIRKRLHHEFCDERGRFVSVTMRDGKPAARQFTTAAGRVKKESRVRVGSVELFQGREAAFVIVSAVRSKDESAIGSDSVFDIGFLSNPKRANVALSRARDGLVIVGNARTLLRAQSDWRRVVELSVARNALVKPSGGCGRWNSKPVPASVVAEWRAEGDLCVPLATHMPEDIATAERAMRRIEE